MRAIVIPRNGPPEVFEERELPDRHLAPKDVRIRVEAAGVNFADLMARVGLYPDAPKEMPYAPGYEVAGTVEEVGAKVEPPIVVGARVVAATRFWGYADRVRTPAYTVAVLPANVPFPVAAALPVNYLTAYLGLLHVGNARPGERVLVHGGAGGVGLATLDLARGQGLELYATAGSDEKCRMLEAKGVVKAVNYRTSDYEVELPRGDAGARHARDPRPPRPRVVREGAAAPGAPRADRVLRLLGPRDGQEAQPLARGDVDPRQTQGEPDHPDDEERGGLRPQPRAPVGGARPVVPRARDAGRARVGGHGHADDFGDLPLDRGGRGARHHDLHDRKNVGKVGLVRA